ncbi:type III pantothenate kinase [Verrucomicrobiaceae bacterium N1E253]|uniref:Type III pantothenate kinase n=1 Tax=Oceaniferula marina TaxID=2748318 RepID=A0A851GMT5_9BACT|nr:type III pantothenate kinase [Oceaniferula marina]NWK55424.1 type III pantothenate kinase [Oceaniferula marina]
MRTLLVDNSNTRTKFALSDDKQLLDWRAIIPTADISAESLAHTLANTQWDRSIISSVVPAKASTLEEYLKAKPCHLVSYKSQLPIGIDYPYPEQIGADRLVNAAAAHVLYGSPSIVLDFGTAVTFDVITATGAPNHQSPKPAPAMYCGGVIAPGLAAMTEGLARRTALLPQIELEEPERAVGKSTEEAMLAGAVYGYRGLVREIITELRKEIPGEPIIIATGGDAPLITRGLPDIQHLAPQLTLEGLSILADLNN